MRIFLICVLVLVIALSAAGQSPFSTEVDSLILAGIDQIYACRFDSAMTFFLDVTDIHPDLCVGYFYQAVTLQTMMMDTESNLMEDEFNGLIRRQIPIQITES